MRTIIILILYVIITILSIPCYLIEWIIRLINPMAAAKIAQVIVKGVFNLVMFVSGCRKEIVGLERIPRDTPVMYAANHRSFYDIVLAYATVPNQTAFISKRDQKDALCRAVDVFPQLPVYGSGRYQTESSGDPKCHCPCQRGVFYLYRTGRHPQRHRHFAGV